jgi:hypothetical protein
MFLRVYLFEIPPSCYLHLYCEQTCAESQIFHEKSSQVTQKSSHDFDFFEKNKKVKVMTLTFSKNPKKSKS